MIVSISLSERTTVIEMTPFSLFVNLKVNYYPSFVAKQVKFSFSFFSKGLPVASDKQINFRERGKKRERERETSTSG